jgi:hypothetical protein
MILDKDQKIFSKYRVNKTYLEIFRDVYSKSDRLMPNYTVGGNQFDLVLGPMARPIPPALGNAQGTRKPITINSLPPTASHSLLCIVRCQDLVSPVEHAGKFRQDISVLVHQHCGW